MVYFAIDLRYSRSIHDLRPILSFERPRSSIIGRLVDTEQTQQETKDTAHSTEHTAHSTAGTEHSSKIHSTAELRPEC